MTVWFTADHHFGHEKIIEYCNRPFSHVDIMDEVLIRRWNSKVKPKDIVYHLGDFTLGDEVMARSYFRKLNGQINIIPGSHDWSWTQRKKSKEPYFSKQHYSEVMIREPIHIVNGIVLCHYAMRVWYKSHYGSVHLYGHSHGQTPIIQIPNSMDVGVDTNDFYPYSLKDIYGKLEIAT